MYSATKHDTNMLLIINHYNPGFLPQVLDLFSPAENARESHVLPEIQIVHSIPISYYIKMVFNIHDLRQNGDTRRDWYPSTVHRMFAHYSSRLTAILDYYKMCVINSLQAMAKVENFEVDFVDNRRPHCQRSLNCILANETPVATLM